MSRDQLFLRVIANVLLALVLVIAPTALLLGLIGGYMHSLAGGAVLVELQLGTLLLFPSLAAILTPLVYRTFPSS